MDEKEEVFRENSQAVQSHLNILQSVINRMAANSVSVKAWCVTLVSAILILGADKGKSDYVWIAIIPTFLFLTLDAYYLALEKEFRNSYKKFVRRLHSGTLNSHELFEINPSGNHKKELLNSLFSISVLPFYLTLIGMIYLTANYVQPGK